MNLESLTINGLFGHFNHEIEFKEENITILTAPNGYGKTICLKVIDAIFNKRFKFLSDLQFSSILLKSSEGSILIEKKFEKDPNTITIKHSNYKTTHKYSHEDYSVSASVRSNLSKIEIHIPFLTRVGPREWEDVRTDEVFSLNEVMANFSEYLPTEFSTSKKLPDWFDDFSSSLNVHFIQDQRLILRKQVDYRGRTRKSYSDTIEKYAEELSDLIKESGFRSALTSQQLDTTFPERLLRPGNSHKSMSAEVLKKELQRLQEKRNALSSFNILASEQHLPAFQIQDNIKEEDTKVLTLYVEDTKQKLASYDRLYKKVELFSRILNSKRLSFKTINIDANRGFYFETEDGSPLKLTQLSSGEQHQVVLLYELIFKTKEDVLVLIDEPEISLHVAWQKEFLKDLKEIIEIQNMPVVIATHSPQIIDNNWHLTVNLEGGDN